MLSTQTYLLILMCFEYAYGLRKEFCEYRDEVCLTEGVRQHAYTMFVAGVPGVECSDPMNFDEIIADLPDCAYKLQKPTVTGFKSCQFKKLKLTQDAQNHTAFDFEVLCPDLTLHSDYEVKNTVGLWPNQETGNCDVIYNNYFITLKGKYKIVNDEYNKAHISIIDCNPILDLQAGATCKYNSSIVNGGKLDNDYNKIEELSRPTVMNTVMKKYMKNLKNFLIAIPIEELHFRYI